MPGESKQTAGAEAASAQRPSAGRSDSKGSADQETTPAPLREIGGPQGPEPTRYGDWERAGRCVDF